LTGHVLLDSQGRNLSIFIYFTDFGESTASLGKLLKTCHVYLYYISFILYYTDINQQLVKLQVSIDPILLHKETVV